MIDYLSRPTSVPIRGNNIIFFTLLCDILEPGVPGCSSLAGSWSTMSIQEMFPIRSNVSKFVRSPTKCTRWPTAEANTRPHGDVHRVGVTAWLTHDPSFLLGRRVSQEAIDTHTFQLVPWAPNTRQGSGQNVRVNMSTSVKAAEYQGTATSWLSSRTDGSYGGCFISWTRVSGLKCKREDCQTRLDAWSQNPVVLPLMLSLCHSVLWILTVSVNTLSPMSSFYRVDDS